MSTVRKVIELPSTDRFFLWAIRAWASAHTDITEVWWSLDRGFTREQVPAALEPFHRLMSALFAGLTRWPDIRCVRCPYVGTQEAQLLAALAAFQCGNEAAARTALQDWIRPAAARQACRDGRVCMAIAAVSGIRIGSDRRVFVPDLISFDSCSQHDSALRSSASQFSARSPQHVALVGKRMPASDSPFRSDHAIEIELHAGRTGGRHERRTVRARSGYR